MNIALALLWFLLAAKLFWNLSIPFVLARRAAQGGGDSDGGSGGVSLAMFVEFVIMGALAIAAALSVGEHWWNQWPFTLAVASGATLASYGILFLIVRVRTQ